MPAILSLDDRQVPLSGDRFVIGRDPDCDITIDDTVASRRHAELRKDSSGKWQLIDLDSANGTRVNSQKVSLHQLQDGDAITLGGTLMVYLDADTAGTRTAVISRPTVSDLPETDRQLPLAGSTQAKAPSSIGAAKEVKPASAPAAEAKQPAAAKRAEDADFRPESLVGKEISGYKMQEILGRGAFGIVYKARQISMQRDVAFKVIPGQDESDAEQALAEARLAGSIAHPGIARVDQCGRKDGFTWYSMELIEGHTLQQLLKRDGPFSSERAITLAYRVAKAMAAANEQNIVHRDIKPANIMISMEGQIKIMDLGLALIVEESDIGGSSDGVIAGTPHYISPSNYDGKTLTSVAICIHLAVHYSTSSPVSHRTGVKLPKTPCVCI